MSLEQAIKHGKEKRKPYRGAKAADGWCKKWNLLDMQAEPSAQKNGRANKVRR